MPNVAPDPAHFVRAVTELGEQRPVVARNAIFNTRGLKLIDKGAAVDARLYERLMQHHLQAPLDESVDSEPGVTGPGLRDAARRLCEREPFFGAMAADPRMRDMLLDELELVPLPPAIAFQLTLARETQPDLWQRTLRSAVTAGWLVARSGGSRFDVRMLAAAGLLHDLGLLHLDPVLLKPEIELSGEQRRQLYSHPLVSVMLLERHHDYPRELLRAVLEHHEALDASGTAQHRCRRPQPWGRILSLAEVVGAMFRPDRPAPALRLSLVLRMNRHRYDPDLVREVTALLPAAREAVAAPVAGDPVQILLQVDRLLAAWPQGVPQDASPTAERALAVDQIHDQCGRCSARWPAPARRRRSSNCWGRRARCRTDGRAGMDRVRGGVAVARRDAAGASPLAAGGRRGLSDLAAAVAERSRRAERAPSHRVMSAGRATARARPR